MKIFYTVKELENHIAHSGHFPKGFVPTMGALHRGHISLVEAAMKECPLTVVSIFVNPSQFNDKKDLENYPRMPQKDIELLSGSLREADFLFMPSEEEIYPAGLPEPVFDFGNLDKVMEGIHRPGHFTGVARVVNRLFDIVRPDIAYFGQKDFQQYTIIKELARQRWPGIKIKACPIVRESDGLAMSSRNILLSPEIRQRAGIIYRTLSEASAMTDSIEISEIRKFVEDTINRTPGFRLEYFEITDDTSLIPVETRYAMEPDKEYYACIAVWAGSIRLIDNIEFRCSLSKG